MKETLNIIKDGVVVNTYETTDPQHVIRDFAHCFATKINGVQTTARHLPNSNKIKVTHKWPNVGGSAYKYAYVFEDVLEDMQWR